MNTEKTIEEIIAEKRLEAIPIGKVATIMGMSYYQAVRTVPKLKNFPPPLTKRGRKMWRAADVYDYRES